MDAQNLLAIISICVSTILSIGAIALSVVFFIYSNKQNKETAIIENNIKNSIDKLEGLYNRTYTDTFGALKTQLDAMQRHIFKEPISTNAPDDLIFELQGFIQKNKNTTIDKILTHFNSHSKDKICTILEKFNSRQIISFDGYYINEHKKQHLSVDGE